LRPTGPRPASDYSADEQAAAKTKICEAHRMVSGGVRSNTQLAPPGGDGDAIGALAVAANARISLFFGGQYLLAKLDPATPTELADQAKAFAGNLIDIGQAATAGIPNSDPKQAKRLKDTDEMNNKMVELCK
jgi:hypothetical protein